MKYIYKAENLINNKVYIGQTNDINRRIKEHYYHRFKDKNAFHDDVITYGIDAFKFSIIAVVENQIADDVEKSFISSYRNAYGVDNVYNYCDGGIGGKTHDMSGENNPSFGKYKTEEEKQHLSEMLKGRIITEDHRNKISKALKNKKKDPSVVAKRSDPISVKNINTGEIISFPSKAEAIRTLKTDERTLKSGKITASGYKLISEW